MKIRVLYFAMLREIRGMPEETLDVSKGATPQFVLDQIFGQTKLPPLRVAINQQYQDKHTPLCEGDEVVFIPPVAGG